MELYGFHLKSSVQHSINSFSFCQVFSHRKTFIKTGVLMMGALLCQRGVNVCAALRAVDLSAEE